MSYRATYGQRKRANIEKRDYLNETDANDVMFSTVCYSLSVELKIIFVYFLENICLHDDFLARHGSLHILNGSH